MWRITAFVIKKYVKKKKKKKKILKINKHKKLTMPQTTVYPRVRRPRGINHG